MSSFQLFMMLSYPFSYTGTLPKEYSNIETMYLFYFQNNKLNGTIPSEYARWTKSLHTFLVETNELEGKIYIDKSTCFFLNSIHIS